MTEHARAKQWREERGLTLDSLADLTGYTRQMIYWMERGQSPPNASHKKPARVSPWIWQRYKMMCAGVEAQLQTGKTFDWGL
ncbi:MAG: helix-turn-helix transcriptional regulator [Hyphomicrobium sp.]